MASIQELKSPLTGAISYRVQVRVKGRPALSETFPNKKEAKAWANATEAAIREGKHFPHLKASRTQFAEVVDRFVTTVCNEQTVEQHNRRKQLAWWRERFAGMSLAEVTPDLVATARDELAAGTYTRGKPQTDPDTGEVTQPTEYVRTGATVNKYLSALSGMFTVAIKEWRLLDRNPVADISKKKEPRGRVRFLTDEERDALLNACAASAWPALHTLVLLAISTGARRSELIHLKWADIDLKASTAILHETKNGDRRVLPLVGKALDAMRELKLQGSARSEWVFPQPSGFPGPFEYFDSHWYAAVDAAGIKDFRFHDLRHTCASYLASQGASLLEIADVLGHRTMAMVKRYSHLAQGHKATVIEKMAKERGL